MMNLKNLQNGSDIRGVAIEGVENEPVNLTPEITYLLGRAFAKWLIKDLTMPAESKEFRVAIKSKDFYTYGSAVIEQMRNWAENQDNMIIQEPNYEGLRVKCTGDSEKGWFLIRLSLHDPVLPINVESDISGGIKNITNRLKEIISSFSKLKLPF